MLMLITSLTAAQVCVCVCYYQEAPQLRMPNSFETGMIVITYFLIPFMPQTNPYHFLKPLLPVFLSWLVSALPV